MYGQYFEGDIKLTEEQQQQLNSTNLRTLSQIGINLWPGGIVPYTFASNSFSKLDLKFKI